MRRFVSSFLALACLSASLASTPALADTDKKLHNDRGTVSHGIGSNQTAVAPHADATVADSEIAQTGSNSLGAIVMPDSSRIRLASNTQVQVGTFTPGVVNSASFVIVRGKVRFQVEHPQGARANYTFKTGTAQIAVRGTEGDVAFDDTSNTLQVNVYQLSNPELPVQVTLPNGQLVVLHAGQSLVVHLGALAGAAGSGAAQATVSNVSQTAYQPFAEFGAPVNAAALGIVPLAHLGLLPILSAVVVDTALVTVTSRTTTHTTTSTTSGPGNTTVPVHVSISVPVIHFP